MHEEVLPVRRPAFLITIDTEGDDLWSRSRTITTRNAAYVPRFQRLCEKYGLKATYLTNWEMANCPAFQEFAADALSRGTAEVGMHLHAWNCPPLISLTEDDYLYHPYLIEYPAEVMRQKVKQMTERLEEVFGRKMVSHRAGRFSFNATYARILLEHGYRVDCSVTPRVSWRNCGGDPRGEGGSDFSLFPDRGYLLDLEDISRPGRSPLLEVPVTVMPPYLRLPGRWTRAALGSVPLVGRVVRHFLPALAWLYPKGHNHRWLGGVLEAVCRDGRDYAEFMIHSSELMPGGSPNYPSAASVEALYEVLEELFAQASGRFEGQTLSGYYRRFTAEMVSQTSRERSAVPSAVAWPCDIRKTQDTHLYG